MSLCARGTQTTEHAENLGFAKLHAGRGQETEVAMTWSGPKVMSVTASAASTSSGPGEIYISKSSTSCKLIHIYLPKWQNGIE